MLLFAAVAGCLALLVIGPGLTGTTRRLVRVVGIYGVLAYLVRGLLLYWLEPAPRYGSVVADARLAAIGYRDGLDQVLPLVCLGALALYLAVRLGDRRFPKVNVSVNSRVVAAVVPIYVIGWLVRCATVAIHVNALSGLLSHLSDLPAAALLGTVFARDWRQDPRLKRLIYVGLALEAVWSVVATSKTPILVALLALYLDPHRSRWRARQVLGVAVAMVFAFAFIQSLKPGSAERQPIDWGDPAGTATTTALNVTARLDGLEALTAAKVRGPGSFMSAGEFVRTGAADLLPQSLTGSTKQLSGQLWGERIYDTDNGTSYASGTMGEGYAVAGTLGVAIWSAWAGLLLVASSRGLPSGLLYVRWLATAMVASTALFERGLLGIFEQFGNAIQIALIAILVCMVTTGRKGWTRRGGVPTEETGTRHEVGASVDA